MDRTRGNRQLCVRLERPCDMRATHRILGVAMLALLLGACAWLPGAGGASLNGAWKLEAGTDQGVAIPIPTAYPITLKIDGRTVGGISACNHYGGTLDVNGTTIKISALSMTEMACQDDVMAAEAAYLAALPKVTTAARDGDSLVLSGANVELRLARVEPVPNADLVGPLWALDSLISGQVVSSVLGDPTPSLRLKADGSLAVSTGCRDLTGRYVVSGSHVAITLDPYDLIACAEPMGSQDVHVLKVIGALDGLTVAIEGNSMTLTAGTLGLGYRVVTAGS